jgi:hypothetical protein
MKLWERPLGNDGPTVYDILAYASSLALDTSELTDDSDAEAFAELYQAAQDETTLHSPERFSDEDVAAASERRRERNAAKRKAAKGTPTPPAE